MTRERLPGMRRVSPAAALFPLRLFLGLTFVYGGMQKLSDPGFLHPGAATYIGTQLHGFATGTPGGFILRAFALPAPKVAGVGVALAEIAIGLLVTVGLLTRAAAAAGLALNLLLFLTASWNTTPYFLGSDIVFVFAWLPFVLSGSTGQPSLESALDRRERRRGASARRGRRPEPAVTRRTLVGRALAATGAGTVLIAALSAVAKGHYRGASNPPITSLRTGSSSAPSPPAATPHTVEPPAGGRVAGNPSADGAPRRARKRPSPPPPGAVEIGAANRLPRGAAATYRDPSDGSADVVIRQRDGSLSALSAICTHAGCACVYQQGQLVCPCHGSVFNARTGGVEQGPATTPLPAKRVVEHGGKLYALPS